MAELTQAANKFIYIPLWHLLIWLPVDSILSRMAIYIPLWHLLISFPEYQIVMNDNLHSTMASINRIQALTNRSWLTHLHSTMASINLFSGLQQRRRFVYLHSTMASINPAPGLELSVYESYLHSTMASINLVDRLLQIWGEIIYIPLWHLLIYVVLIIVVNNL